MSKLLIQLTLIVEILMEVSLPLVELRCATMDHTAQSVMWVGMMKMPAWCAEVILVLRMASVSTHQIWTEFGNIAIPGIVLLNCIIQLLRQYAPC